MYTYTSTGVLLLLVGYHDTLSVLLSLGLMDLRIWDMGF